MYTWPSLLDEYRREVTLVDDFYKYSINNAQIASELLAEMAENDTVICKGATEEAIAEADEILGLELPPSYKDFLRYSNGLHWRNSEIHLLPVELIGRMSEMSPEAADALAYIFTTEDEEDKKFYDDFLSSFSAEEKDEHGGSLIFQECVLPFINDLIQVSLYENQMGAVIMNPKRTYGKEWEVYYLSFEPGGMAAYASFAEYLEYWIPSYIQCYHWDQRSSLSS